MYSNYFFISQVIINKHINKAKINQEFKILKTKEKKMSNYKKLILTVFIFSSIFIKLTKTDDNVCIKREGCETKKLIKYQRVLISNNGYYQKMCRCPAQLSFNCAYKYCTTDLSTCVSILSMYYQDSLNMNRCYF